MSGEDKSEVMAVNEPDSRDYFNNDYQAQGFAAQRRYPNEELLRFIGGYYFSVPRADRSKIAVLEIGCGSGANLWMIAREGFNAHGLDISREGLKLCEEMLASWGVSATLKQGDMTKLPYDDKAFDVVIDVVSSYCLDKGSYKNFLDEMERVLKPGGRFFSFTPSSKSDCFHNPGESRWIDDATLDSIKNPESPYYGQNFPFRFESQESMQSALVSRRFDVLRNESIGRTYFSGKWYFEFISTVAELRP
jgi:ubiquinone/menaquinone biosynthesis C-methylase UbiE